MLKKLSSMHYTLVAFIFSGFCLLFISASSSNGNFYLDTGSKGKGNVETEKVSQASASSAAVGNMSCAEAHALIRMKKDDQSLREGIWQLEQRNNCPVIREEAYIALQQ